MTVWNCDGGLTSEGDDMPECSYCGKKADSGEVHETNFGGINCCEDNGCVLELGQENLESLWEEREEEDA